MTGAWDQALAARIDHTLLRPDATVAEIDRLCDEALRLHFAAVCVQPCRAAAAAARLRGTPVRLAVVAAFPHGAATTVGKVHEIAGICADGADEVDVVANLGWIREGRFGAVADEVAALVRAAGGRPVKVILETALFDADTQRAAALAARDGGAAFLKTSTGFGPGGATVDSVRLLARVAGDACGVKASGGLRNRADALAMLAAGATRLGCSAGVDIVGGEGAQVSSDP